MKKYLMTGIAAVAFCGAFTSCGNEEIVQLSQKEINEAQAQARYDAAFIQTFGKPAANQDWGFGAASRTRATVETPTVTEVGYTFNATMARAWQSAYEQAVRENWGNQVSGHGLFVATEAWANSGWNDKFYQINASSVNSGISAEYAKNIKDAIFEIIPEGGNNIGKASEVGYTVTTEGGPVTVTPVYHDSNSNDIVSYYYYPANDVPTAAQIKELPKYTIGRLGNEGAMLQSFSLVYVDGETVSYDFPADYVICFLVTNTSLENANPKEYHETASWSDAAKKTPNTPEFYGDGSLNAEVHSTTDWSGNVVTDVNNAPHAATFSANGYSFVGFEDWTDMDCNDLVLAIDGVTGGEEITVEDPDSDPDPDPNPDPTPTPTEYQGRIFAEDLSATESSDFDFNDVVFDWRIDEGVATIQLLAAGGTLELYIGGEPNDDATEIIGGVEVHDKFGVGTSTMVNTGESEKNVPNPFTVSAASANDIKIWVKKNGTFAELKAERGKPACKINVPTGTQWVDEYANITEAYSWFSDYVSGEDPQWSNVTNSNFVDHILSNNGK